MKRPADSASHLLEAVVGRGNVAVALIRHGRTAWNHERRFLGVTDLGLDELGWSQARALGEATRGSFSAVYCSPLSRASQTASCLSQSLTEIADLRELAQGELEGLLVSEAIGLFPAFFQRWGEDPTDEAPPGGESLRSCRDRSLCALTEIVRGHRPGDVLAVVSHQLVIASATCTIAGQDLARWSEFGVKNCEGVVLEWDGENWQIAGAFGIGTDLMIPPGSGTVDV